MELSAIIMMTIAIVIPWGSAIFCLAIALRRKQS